jgi:LmbE family N-acetylglucosaminyl deacetylase
MFQLRLEEASYVPCKVLCLGAHSDDIEIGCGGTMLRLLQVYPKAEVWWVVLSAAGVRRREAQGSARALLQTAAKSRIVVKQFRESFMPFHGEDVKEFFEELKSQLSPDLIFTHYRHDLHQDHRVVSDFTWNTFRNHLIFEYEIPKYDGDIGCPNVFVPLTRAMARTKVAHLLQYFVSQRGRQWFTEDLFLSLLRIRGMECNAPSKLAEAFYVRKWVF